jgi:hypothetical protein
VLGLGKFDQNIEKQISISSFVGLVNF